VTARWFAILVGFLAACHVQTAVMFFQRRRLCPWVWMAVRRLVMLFVILMHPDARLSALVVTSWTIGWSIDMFSSRRVKATFVR
jgi:hypothetical protein